MGEYLRHAVMAVMTSAAVGAAWLWLTGGFNECSFAPRVVTYRPGMKLCPGQTLELPPVFILPLPLLKPAPEALPGRPV